MEAIRSDREAIMRLANDKANPRFQSIWFGDVSAEQMETVVKALPPDVESYTFLQNEQGQKYFVEGISQPGGPDIMPPAGVG